MGTAGRGRDTGPFHRRLPQPVPARRRDRGPEPPRTRTAQGTQGGAQIFPAGSRIADPRTAEPGIRATGPVPAGADGTARTALADLGLPGLLLGGGGTDTPPWTVATGWADLDRGEVLQTSHRFPVYQLTTLVTATAVLRLVADGRAGLDDQANGHLRTVRLADDTVTIRELLTHTAGVSTPADRYASTVPDLATLTGPVIGCDGPRGVFQHSDAGYAALGQLIADITRAPYAEAAARLVLRPLGMADSSFPATWPGSGTITGYTVTADGSFASAPASVAALPAAAGLWSTAEDLVRFGLGWSSLLPGPLAREARTPLIERAFLPGHVGLGWIVNEASGLIGHGGTGPGASVSLLIPVGASDVRVALANRVTLIESVNASTLPRDIRRSP
jgi:CubicO group peptidase (beta-lactamase class C family)